MPDTQEFAFPLLDSATDNAHFGLTKREYFAAMALQGIMANPSPSVTEYFGKYPETVVGIADLLIKELNKERQ